MIFVVHWYEHVEGHRNEPATNNDLALTALRLETELARNISTELHHVLIMLTTGPAQQLVLKAAQQEGLEACRLLVQRNERGFFDRFRATSDIL